jgi:hypothetical protein
MLNPYFEDLYINFENNCLIEQPGFSVPIKNAFFGILKLVAPSCDITKDTQELIFVIDRSGSMSDLCSDNRSKMQHIIHTLKNMVLYLKDCNNDVKIYVTIFVFDNKFSYSLKRTTINNDNIENIIQTIEKIRPLGSTNIELALTDVKEYINQRKKIIKENKEEYNKKNPKNNEKNTDNILVNRLNQKILDYKSNFEKTRDAFLKIQKEYIDYIIENVDQNINTTEIRLNPNTKIVIIYIAE